MSPAVRHLTAKTRYTEGANKVNADQIAYGASRTICALISSLFLEIHKVFLRKSAIIRTQILSGFALADLIIVYQEKRRNTA